MEENLLFWPNSTQILPLEKGKISCLCSHTFIGQDHLLEDSLTYIANGIITPVESWKARNVAEIVHEMYSLNEHLRRCL